jgi:hypothetical protein
MHRSAEARLTAWAESLNSRPANSTTTPSTVTYIDSGSDVGDPSSRQSTLALSNLLTVIGEATARLSEVTRAVEAAATRSSAAANATRTVGVTARGDTITGVDFDDQWLREAHPDRIGAAVHEALTACLREAAAAKERAIDGGPELDRVRRLANSPEQLLREVGLLR